MLENADAIRVSDDSVKFAAAHLRGDACATRSASSRCVSERSKMDSALPYTAR
jgi:hypothetical protein